MLLASAECSNDNYDVHLLYIINILFVKSTKKQKAP